MEVTLFSQKIETFILGLEKATIAKSLRTIDLLERFGQDLGMPHSKKIDNGIFELRIRGKQEVRFIYAFRKNTIILLHGFIKKKQRIPKKVMELAKKRLSSLDL